MTHLYPRLLSSRGRALFEEFKGITSPDDLRAHASNHDDSAIYIATGGTRVSPEQLDSLASAVRQLAEVHRHPYKPHWQSPFDVKLAKLLHSSMDVSPAEAASREMWSFLSMILLPDIAYWRFPSPPQDRVINTDITRHVFGRLWWRAELIHDPEDADPYDALTILGEADFDHVYARRAQIGASPKIVRNLLRVWRDLRSSGELSEVNDREAFRGTLVILRRLVPFLSLNAIDDEDLAGELRRTALQAIAEQRVS